MTLRGHRYVVSRSPQDASVLSHKYLTRCAAPFRAGRRCASSPVPFNCLCLVGAPCPARDFAGGSSKVFMGQDTRDSVERARAPAMQLELFLPKYWATWVGLSVLRTIELLPFPAQRHLGSALGKLIRHLPLAYVRLARRNIELCMPALSAQGQAELIDRHCQSLGVGLCETANTWWSSDGRVNKLAEIHGLENLQAALAKGRGAIMIGGHFTTIE